MGNSVAIPGEYMRANCMRVSLIIFMTLRFMVSPTLCAMPMSVEEVKYQEKLEAQLKASIAEATGTAALSEVFITALNAESDYLFRRIILNRSNDWITGGLEPVLLHALADSDAGIRSQATSMLGTSGSSAAITQLVKVAAMDPNGHAVYGCFGRDVDVRADAYRALVQIGEHHPDQVRTIIAQIKAIRTSTPRDLNMRDAALTRLQKRPHNYMSRERAAELLLLKE